MCSRQMPVARARLPRPACPGCGEPWLRPTQLPGRFRCVYCLRRYELVSQCPNCGEHQTIARMSSTEDMICQHCRRLDAEAGLSPMEAATEVSRRRRELFGAPPRRPLDPLRRLLAPRRRRSPR